MTTELIRNGANDAALGEALSWVGQGWEQMNCFQLIRAAYNLRGIELPADYYDALQRFRPISEPAAWDVVAFGLHPIFTLHCGLYLGENRVLHSMEGVGVTVADLRRAPWSKPGVVKGFVRLRRDA